MNRTFRNLVAICIGVLPVHFGMIYYRLTQDTALTTNDMVLYPLLIGGGSALLIFLLNKYLLKQPLSIFNPGKGNWWQDIIAGLVLTGLMFILVVIERRTLVNWLPMGPPPTNEIFDLMRDLSESPLLLILYFGPVLVIGIALFEEVTRIFLLNTLWDISKNRSWQITVIILVSILMGAVHLYQGWFGIVSIGIKSILMCLYYYRFRRIMPLLISHYLYDGIQFAMFISAIQ